MQQYQQRVITTLFPPNKQPVVSQYMYTTSCNNTSLKPSRKHVKVRVEVDVNLRITHSIVVFRSSPYLQLAQLLCFRRLLLLLFLRQSTYDHWVDHTFDASRGRTPIACC